jgi:hypothetical protein
MKKFTIQIETLKTTRFFIFTKTFINDECPICFDNILPETRAKVGCNHSFCIDCIKEHIIYSENKKSLTCPCCRTPITNMKLCNKIEMNNIKNLVNVPQKYNEIRDESRFSEVRLYERRRDRIIVVRSSEARI